MGLGKSIHFETTGLPTFGVKNRYIAPKGAKCQNLGTIDIAEGLWSPRRS